MDQVPITYRRLPTIKVCADLLVSGIATTMQAITEQLFDTLQELGHTTKQRDQLAEQLASSCYATRHAIPGFPRRILRVLLSEQELQELFILWMRHTPHEAMVEQCLKILSTHKEVPYDPMPEVPRDERITHRRAASLRTRRDPRRTHRCDERAMPEDGLPA